jgi:two-component system CheB/CheR fusion protein
MAFVVVADSDVPINGLAETIGGHTPMPVAEAVDGALARPNSVYVLPWGARARLHCGAFRIELDPGADISRSIGIFFCSLASAQKTRAIGVLLAGTNGEGDQGAEAIRDGGGVVIVEEPETLSPDDIGRILPPREIAAELTRMSREFQLREQLRIAKFARSLIESLPLPVALFDAAFRVCMANGAFRSLAAIPEGNFEGRSLRDLSSALGNPEELLRSPLDPGATFSFEHETPGENSKVLNIRGCVVHADGDAYLLATFEDIGARKRFDRAMLEERKRLQDEVVSITIELSRTRKELRALTARLFTSQEEERRRVARELHDDISQKLALLEIDAQQAEPKITSNPGQGRRDMERLRNAIGALSEEVRRISHALHPAVIEDLGITPAIRSLVEDFGEREAMSVTFRTENVPESLPLETATGLYRIAQEALRNVVKHAGKTQVAVVLRGEEGSLLLEVIDEGKGFDPRNRNSGLGLVSVEERTRMMRGALKIDSQPGKGTRVTVEVPLR